MSLFSCFFGGEVSFWIGIDEPWLAFLRWIVVHTGWLMVWKDRTVSF